MRRSWSFPELQWAKADLAQRARASRRATRHYENDQGNIRDRKKWCRRRDLNPRPTHYECVALPAELRRHRCPWRLPPTPLADTAQIRARKRFGKPCGDPFQNETSSLTRRDRRRIRLWCETESPPIYGVNKQEKQRVSVIRTWLVHAVFILLPPGAPAAPAPLTIWRESVPRTFAGVNLSSPHRRRKLHVSGWSGAAGAIANRQEPLPQA